MAVKETAFAALLAGLSTDQLAEAELSRVYSDLGTHPGGNFVYARMEDLHHARARQAIILLSFTGTFF